MGARLLGWCTRGEDSGSVVMILWTQEKDRADDQPLSVTAEKNTAVTWQTGVCV